jgi:membrane fusion protein, multidrug efflux system
MMDVQRPHETAAHPQQQALERPHTLPVTAPSDEPDAKKPKGKRRLASYVLALLIVGAAGTWLYLHYRVAPAPQRTATPAMPVTATSAVKGDLDITLDALGTVTSLATVTVVSQTSGQLMRVAYTEGQEVKKGDLLVEIDSRPFDLALAQAQGALARDQALLQNAELDLKRYQDLSKENAVPRQQFDTQVSLVLQDRGNVISDQAQIETQKLNISYCHIAAPVDGRVGLRLVDPGNYVTPSLITGLAVITQVMPITVIFPVAEDYLPQILKRDQGELAHSNIGLARHQRYGPRQAVQARQPGAQVAIDLFGPRDPRHWPQDRDIAATMRRPITNSGSSSLARSDG